MRACPVAPWPGSALPQGSPNWLYGSYSTSRHWEGARRRGALASKASRSP